MSCVYTKFPTLNISSMQAEAVDGMPRCSVAMIPMVGMILSKEVLILLLNMIALRQVYQI